LEKIKVFWQYLKYFIEKHFKKLKADIQNKLLEYNNLLKKVMDFNKLSIEKIRNKLLESEIGLDNAGG
jgi:hypothetical protein